MSKDLNTQMATCPRTDGENVSCPSNQLVSNPQLNLDCLQVKGERSPGFKVIKRMRGLGWVSRPSLGLTECGFILLSTNFVSLAGRQCRAGLPTTTVICRVHSILNDATNKQHKGLALLLFTRNVLQIFSLAEEKKTFLSNVTKTTKNHLKINKTYQNETTTLYTIGLHTSVNYLVSSLVVMPV
jgi:hypothetical protein